MLIDSCIKSWNFVLKYGIETVWEEQINVSFYKEENLSVRSVTSCY